MRITGRTSLVLALLLGTSVSTFAKEWRGIVPLQSTRADVIRLLGSPRHLQWDYRDYFEIENAVVTFTWIDPTCLRKYPIQPDSSIQPQDVVLSISIGLKKPIAVPELHLPDGKFYFGDCLGHRGGDSWSCTYLDCEDGFGYGETKAGVTSLSYFASADAFDAWLRTHSACKWAVE
jgi:hypothetical protein